MALLVQGNPLATAWSISSDEFLSTPFWSAGRCSRVSADLSSHHLVVVSEPAGEAPRRAEVASGGLGDMCKGPVAASPDSRHAAHCEHQGLDHG